MLTHNSLQSVSLKISDIGSFQPLSNCIHNNFCLFWLRGGDRKHVFKFEFSDQDPVVNFREIALENNSRTSSRLKSCRVDERPELPL